MTTNSLVSLDLSATPRISAPRVAQAAERSRNVIAWRGLVGGCLLSIPRLVWMVLDVALVCTGTALGDRMFVWWDQSSTLLADYNVWVANAVLGSAVVLAGSVFGLYEPTTLWARSRIVVRCLLTVCLAMLASWLILHLFMYSPLSRRAAACGTVFFLITASMLRLLSHYTVRDVRRGLLVIGQGPLTGSIIRSVRRGAVPGYRLVGIVAPDLEDPEDLGGGARDIPVVGRIEDIEALCRQHDVAEVVVAETAGRHPTYQRGALSCLRRGCRVTDETTFYESTYGEVPVLHITPNWFLAADLKGQRKEHAVLKRVFDVMTAGLALVLTLPFQLLISILIRLEDGGPAVYSQTRVGQGGQPFTLYKFRTMRCDAEADGSTWAKPNDPRVTRIGRILRRVRFDELPQLWNILKGEMSLVGPRPERPEFVNLLGTLIPFYDERHLIKPGLTGWAQIGYRYGASVADARRKLQLDLYYIKNMSIELDLIILLRTLGTFFLGAR